MNWQAEFLDNPEIRLTFDHFPFFQKQGIMENRFSFDYQHYDSPEGMPGRGPGVGGGGSPGRRPGVRSLFQFRVGAAARLRSGKILCGSNQESEVFPAGMCAERSLLFHAGACHATIRSRRWPLLRSRPRRECYPCGQCRQVLLDAERRQGSPIRIIMSGAGGATVVDSAVRLLPFTFQL